MDSGFIANAGAVITGSICLKSMFSIGMKRMNETTENITDRILKNIVNNASFQYGLAKRNILMSFFTRQI